MSDEKLFSAFPPDAYADWLERAQKELKDRTPEEVLHYARAAGISAEAYSIADPATPISSTDRRGVKRANNNWRITVPVNVGDPRATNKDILASLEGGADAIELYGKLGSTSPTLDGVWLGAIDLQLDGDAHLLDELLALHAKQNTPPTEVSICLGLSHDSDVRTMKSAIAKYPLVRLFAVSDQRQPGEANVVEPTRRALDQGRALIERLLAQGFTIDDAAARVQFRLHLGDDLFVEAARIRAFRACWAQVISSFSPTHHCSRNAWVQCVVSFDSAAKAPYDNAIRATLQAISAITGGCDGLTIPDLPLPEGARLGRRIARNISLLCAMNRSSIVSAIHWAGASQLRS